MDLQQLDQAQRATLDYRAHKDLRRRARAGIFIYLVSWLVITLPATVHLTHPDLFAINTGILLVVMAARLCHWLILPAREPSEVAFSRHCLVTLVLLGACHWGLLTAWVVAQPGLDSIRFNMAASAAVFGIGGATSLCIDPTLRRYFTALMLTPMVVALLWRGVAGDHTLAALALIASLYALVTGKTSSEDYWQALRGQLMAEGLAADMQHLSETDSLTQLRNRSYFDARIGEEWQRALRQRNPLSVLLLDLDNFKQINDTHGHAFGDAVLEKTAKILAQAILREYDLVARYGGEEFAILLPDTHAEAAGKIAERVRGAVERTPVQHGKTRIDITCSIGGATMIPHRESSTRTLLKQADDALYASKTAGRNRYTAAPESAGRAR